MKKVYYSDMANDYKLWIEYFDKEGLISEDEFNKMIGEECIEMIREASGKEFKYLKEDAFYMNPETGSVDTGRNWEQDFVDAGHDYEDCIAWEEWGGESLCEVEKDKDGDWVEVK